MLVILHVKLRLLYTAECSAINVDWYAFGSGQRSTGPQQPPPPLQLLGAAAKGGDTTALSTGRSYTTADSMTFTGTTLYVSFNIELFVVSLCFCLILILFELMSCLKFDRILSVFLWNKSMLSCIQNLPRWINEIGNFDSRRRSRGVRVVLTQDAVITCCDGCDAFSVVGKFSCDIWRHVRCNVLTQ